MGKGVSDFPFAASIFWVKKGFCNFLCVLCVVVVKVPRKQTSHMQHSEAKNVSSSHVSGPPAPPSEGLRRVPCPRAGAPRCCLSAVVSYLTFYVSLFCVCTSCPCWLYVHWLFTASSRLSVFMLTHANALTQSHKASRASGKSGPWVCPCSSATVRLESSDGRQLDGFPFEPRQRQSLFCFVFLLLLLQRKQNVHDAQSQRLTRSRYSSTRGRSLHTVLKTMSKFFDPYFSSSSPLEQYCIIIEKTNKPKKNSLDLE